MQKSEQQAYTMFNIPMGSLLSAMGKPNGWKMLVTMLTHKPVGE